MKRSFCKSTTCAIFISLTLGSISVFADLDSRIKMEMNLSPSIARDTLGPILENRNLVFADIKIHGIGFLKVFEDYAISAKDDLDAKLVSIVSSDFNLDWTDDAVRLRGQLLGAYLKGGKKPLIVYGNPVSGPTAILAAAFKPDLFTSNVVDRIISFQGVFNGSPYSEEYSDICSLPFENLSCMFFNSKVARMSKYSPSNASKVFSSTIEQLDAKVIESLREKVYYVRSSKDPEEMAFPLVPGAKELFNGLPTDGISYTKDQYLPDIGNDLGVVSADHWELTASIKIPLSKNQSRFRKAVLRSTLVEMYNR